MSKKFSGITFRLFGQGTHILGIPYEKLFFTFTFFFFFWATVQENRNLDGGSRFPNIFQLLMAMRIKSKYKSVCRVYKTNKSFTIPLSLNTTLTLQGQYQSQQICSTALKKKTKNQNKIRSYSSNYHTAAIITK